MIPSDEICEKLSKYRLQITVDDYRDAVPGTMRILTKLIEKLERYKIRYYINKTDTGGSGSGKNLGVIPVGQRELIRHCSEYVISHGRNSGTENYTAAIIQHMR